MERNEISQNENKTTERSEASDKENKIAQMALNNEEEAASAMAATAAKEEEDESEWRLVTARNKHRKSTEDVMSDVKEKKQGRVDNVTVSSFHISPKRAPMNVYERLSSGVLRPPNALRAPVLSESAGRGGLLYPRSAMDLPQTKVIYCSFSQKLRKCNCTKGGSRDVEVWCKKFSP
ncbi:unnamed protein product [Gongylonema pulchrum]|uniref:Uncharacterized protein n=1 Tax=Gongylonema pulchrum TaxID=637853 RepID=A0A183D0W7_9BILA|nr:unnamed protein product [Gongylonema pulchrum]